MDMDHTNRWLTFAANVGVIAGILFLAFEIQQSNRIAIASTEIDVRNSFAEINESVYSNAEFAEIIVRISDADADLTPVEEFRIYGFVLRLVNTWLAIETAYANGMVPQETYRQLKMTCAISWSTFPELGPFFAEHLKPIPRCQERMYFERWTDYLGSRQSSFRHYDNESAPQFYEFKVNLTAALGRKRSWKIGIFSFLNDRSSAKADIKLILIKRAANDPKRKFAIIH